MAVVTIPGQSGSGLPALDPEAAEDLLDVLDDLLVWRLAPDRWERVGHILDTIASAVAAADVQKLIEAVTELELASPVRAHRIGHGDVVPVPQPLRDRANQLVHTVRTGQPPAPQAEAAAKRDGARDAD